MKVKSLSFEAIKTEQDIHRFWRFPGSFHYPVCDWMIEKFTHKNEVILDPMCGSGILPIQAFKKSRRSYGYDIDPFSVLMCKAKSHPYDIELLETEIISVKKKLNRIKRDDKTLVKLAKNDEDDVIEGIPDVYNATHWFKKYVLNDVGRVIQIIKDVEHNNLFFLACLGSIIRKISNADPVPISGLEVTSHFKEKSDGRKIDAVGKYIDKIDSGYDVIERFNKYNNGNNRPVFDLLDINHIDECDIYPNSIIFSPPYCTAIEYYRRHRLEYVLLGLWKHNQIVDESRKFLGNTNILLSGEEKIINEAKSLPGVNRTISNIKNKKRKVCIAKYFIDTNKYLTNFLSIIETNGLVIIVIGDSKSEGIPIPTGDIILKMAKNIGYSIKDVFDYPIKNRRMNYTRRNGANIKTEKILVLSGCRGEKIESV